jgi:hypothetical protein
MTFNKKTTDSFNTATTRMDELLTTFDSMSVPEKKAYLFNLNNSSTLGENNSATFETLTTLDAFVTADKLEFLLELNNASVPEQSKQTTLCTKNAQPPSPKSPSNGN